MFHVSTLLPAAEGDMERIQEKKVHIGNDVIVVVYIEGDEPFSPEVMRSQFNHVFIVVRALKDPTRKLYQVNVAYKSGVDATSPAMPTNAAFEKNSDLRKLLLSKSTLILACLDM
jgi:predicted TIM-barrel enzyme